MCNFHSAARVLRMQMCVSHPAAEMLELQMCLPSCLRRAGITDVPPILPQESWDYRCVSHPAVGELGL